MAFYGLKIDQKDFDKVKQKFHYGDHFIFWPTGENDLEIVLRNCLDSHFLSPKKLETEITKVEAYIRKYVRSELVFSCSYT